MQIAGDCFVILRQTPSSFTLSKLRRAFSCIPCIHPALCIFTAFKRQITPPPKKTKRPMAPSCHDCREAGGWHLPLFSAAEPLIASWVSFLIPVPKAHLNFQFSIFNFQFSPLSAFFCPTSFFKALKALKVPFCPFCPFTDAPALQAARRGRRAQFRPPLPSSPFVGEEYLVGLPKVWERADLPTAQNGLWPLLP